MSSNRFPMILVIISIFTNSSYASSIPASIEIVKKGLKETIITVVSEKDSSINHQYMVAGPAQYRSLWAWDFAFASYGALKSGHSKAVRDSLSIYFENQRTDGFFPRVIDHHRLEFRVPLGMVGIVLDFKEPLIPQYKTENGVISYIPNAMFPWTASRYIQYTNDLEFAQKYFGHAEKGIQWLDKNAQENGLICKQQPYSDWEDSVQRTGCVSFTNILYAYSLRGLSQWAKALGNKEKEAFYLNRYNQFVIQFRSYFWDDTKKVFKNFTGDDHLTADTNLLAVAYQLVDKAQAELILNTLRNSPLWSPYPGRPTWPNYANSMKSFYPRLVGLSGYHDEIHWGWLTALAAIAEKEVGRNDLSQKILDNYAKQILKDGGVYEVYDYDEEKKIISPVTRLVYKAEYPFTWASGIYLEAALP